MARKCKLEQARQLYQAMLNKSRKNKKAIDGLKARKTKGKTPATPSLIQEQLSDVIALYSDGKIQEALSVVEALVGKHPDVAELHNVSGAIRAGLGQLDQAMESFRRALEIKPD